MTEIAGVDRPLTAEEKKARLESDIRAGLVLEKPSCPCGFTSEKPAPLGAGCPKCGRRLGDARKTKKAAKGEGEDE